MGDQEVKSYRESSKRQRYCVRHVVGHMDVEKAMNEMDQEGYDFIRSEVYATQYIGGQLYLFFELKK